jgi:two-component system phosphate regulon response regulator PhoB
MQSTAGLVSGFVASPVRIHRFGPLELDVDRLRVWVGGQPVALEGLQLKLLLFLARRPDCVFSRERLLAEVWDADADRCPTTVDVVVCRLRRRLGAAGRLIESVRGFGYRLKSSQE